MDVIRYAISDFPSGEDQLTNPVLQILARSTRNVHSPTLTSTSLIIRSVFGDRYLRSRAPDLVMNYEPALWSGRPRWSIDWRHVAEPNHLRYPLWACLLAAQPMELSPAPEGERKFCNFIFSNGQCGLRNAFFSVLDSRERVDALGSVLQNATHPDLGGRYQADWRTTKVRVMSDYKFTIAFENSEHVGYTSEKMIDAWLADSVPIYWGDPAVELDFPEDSYLSLYRSGSLTQLVKNVLEAHHDADRYRQLQHANPFRTGAMIGKVATYQHRLDAFVDSICDDLRSSGRSLRYSIPEHLERRIRVAGRKWVLRLGL